MKIKQHKNAELKSLIFVSTIHLHVHVHVCTIIIQTPPYNWTYMMVPLRSNYEA